VIAIVGLVSTELLRKWNFHKKHGNSIFVSPSQGLFLQVETLTWGTPKCRTQPLDVLCARTGHRNGTGSMEQLLRSIGEQQLRRDRKRRREACAPRRHESETDSPQSATGSSPQSATDRAPERAPEQPQSEPPKTEQRPEVVRVEQATHDRAVDAVIALSAQSRSLWPGRAFIGRSTAGAMKAAQAVTPVTVGVDLVAVLYVCFHLVVTSYQGLQSPGTYGSIDVADPKGLGNRELKYMIERLGQGPSKGEQDDAFMMAARQLSRSPEHTLGEHVSRAWSHVVDQPRVWMAVSGVLGVCKRASHLFPP
jgi:hypothetical protein